MSELRERIEDTRVHVLDGAMGTLLYERGVFVNVCYDELNLTQPDLVRGLHEEYASAGAEILETNTFGANPVKLSAWGLEARTEELNARAVELARSAARGRALVVGAMGPLGVRIEPWGPTGRDEAEAFFARQVQGLLEGGVDGFVLETFSDRDELRTAVAAIRATSDLPVFAQMTVGEDGRTSYGTTPAQIAETLSALGVDVVGLNCSVGPAIMLDAIEEMAETVTTPLSAQPNAGIPRTVRDRKIYMASPDYMARYARRLIDAGARFVGGCCGTTPEHVKRIRDYVGSVQPRIPHVQVAVSPTSEPAGTTPRSVPLEQRSRWGRKLVRRQFVTSVEMLPPKGWEPGPLIEQARRAFVAGVDALHLIDSPRARNRMAVIPSALIVQREVGLEPIVHYTCRDRNMPGMISDLLGAAAAGLRNLLLTTGDPSAMGPYPESAAVFDIDSIGLTNVVHRLNQGLDPAGNSIGDPTRFVIGVVARPSHIDPERELERYAWKVEAGAEFAITQIVFDPELLSAHLERTSRWRIPTIATVWPLLSVRNAEYLAHEVPGVDVPEAVIERMRSAEARGSDFAEAEGVNIAIETALAIRASVEGLHVPAPEGRMDLALRVLEGVA